MTGFRQPRLLKSIQEMKSPHLQRIEQHYLSFDFYKGTMGVNLFQVKKHLHFGNRAGSMQAKKIMQLKFFLPYLFFNGKWNVFQWRPWISFKILFCLIFNTSLSLNQCALQAKRFFHIKLLRRFSLLFRKPQNIL